MINAITIQLLAVLLGATLLGIIIGSSVMRLIHNRRLKAIYSSYEGLAAGSDGQHTDDAETKLGALSKDEQVQYTAQQETLQAHANLQSKRVEKLTSELHASEEKCIRLQRDFASFKANKLREVRMLKVSADEWLDDEELPVLNKKVDQVSAHTAAVEPLESDDEQTDLEHSQPLINNELEIPALAEFELPDTVEELEFVLVSDDDESTK